MANGQLNGVMRHIRKLAGWQDISQLSDGQLLDRFIKDHDETAFEALVHKHGPMVLGVCRRILGNQQDAEDAFQATFVVLVRKAASIRPRDMVANWLYGVACRASLKTRSLNGKRRSKESQMAPTTEQSSSPREIWSDVQSVLDEELERLPDKYRGPVVLCDLQGKSRKEAAGQLQIPEGTLSSRLNTARHMLAKKLTRRGVMLSAAGLAALLADNVAAAASTAIPASLAFATVKAAQVAAVGSSVAAAAMSAKAALVADGVVQGMFLAKLKVAAAVILTAGLLTGGAGYVYIQIVSAPGQSGEIVQHFDKSLGQPAQPKHPESLPDTSPVVLPDPPKAEEPRQPEPPALSYKDFMKNGDAEIVKIRQAQLKKIVEEEKQTAEAIKNCQPTDAAKLLQLQLHRQRLHNDRMRIETGVGLFATKIIAPPVSLPTHEQLWGVQVNTPPPVLIAQLGLEKNQGIVIEKVDPASPAAKAGLQTHDILLKIDGKPVPSERKEFKKFLAEVTTEMSVDAVVMRAGKEQVLRGFIVPRR